MHDLLGLPLDASAHGHYIDNIIVVVHWLMLVLFVGWAFYFIYALIRFRRSRNPKADYTGVKSHFSTYSEIGVALFEGFLLVGLAIPVWSNVVVTFPAEKDATVVHVVAEQFAWNVHYPGPDGVFGKRDIHLVTAENPLGLDRNDPAAKDDIATINQLHLPVGKPVIVYLTSKDVIHSFGIPLLRVKQDVIPGQSIPVTFTPTKTDAEIRKALTKHYPITMDMVEPGRPFLSVMKDYKDVEGNPILAKGAPLMEESLKQLLAAGYKEVLATADTPNEIACAQLCGLGHFRMRASVVIQTPQEYQAWLDEEAAYLTQ